LKPKLLIDSISLLSPLTGIGRYTYEVSKYLKNSDDFELSYFYGYYSKQFIDDKSKNTPLQALKSLILKVAFLKRAARILLSITAKEFSPEYDIYWQPNFIPMSGIKTQKIVTTVHDFSFILYRDSHPKERIQHIEKSFFENITKSDILITGSEYSKGEILQRLDFKENQIKVIHHGVNHDIFRLYDKNDLSFDIPKKFILCVGSIEPRKNLLGLLKAYELLSSEIKSEYKLVLVGFKGWQNTELMDIINSDKENISYLGFISDRELAKVYNAASCFVFPSFYEGFGLPPLEAMACATPVIASNLSSMPEICSDSAIYCDPHDSNDIKEKIESLLNDAQLQSRMVEKGLQRAGEFSWEKSAKEHIKVFKEVMES